MSDENSNAYIEGSYAMAYEDKVEHNPLIVVAEPDIVSHGKRPESKATAGASSNQPVDVFKLG